MPIHHQPQSFPQTINLCEEVRINQARKTNQQKIIFKGFRCTNAENETSKKKKWTQKNTRFGHLAQESLSHSEPQFYNRSDARGRQARTVVYVTKGEDQVSVRTQWWSSGHPAPTLNPTKAATSSCSPGRPGPRCPLPLPRPRVAVKLGGFHQSSWSAGERSMSPSRQQMGRKRYGRGSPRSAGFTPTYVITGKVPGHTFITAPLSAHFLPASPAVKR